MKFWKHTLLTTVAFFSVATMVFYTACEKDSCSTLVCMNGGSCVSGLCHCPTGFEDAQCGTRSILRYLGTYAGNTSCNSSSAVLDTVWVTPYSDSTMVRVIQYSNITDTLIGTVSTNASSGSIIIPVDSSNNYLKNITITLNATQLTVFVNEITNVSAGTTNNCTFTGYKSAN